MNNKSRRQFLRSSAAAVGTGVVGIGLSQQRGVAQEIGEPPEYAEWIPQGDSILNDVGELDIGTYTFDEQIELFGEVSAGEDQPLQFEPFIYTASMLGAWRALSLTNLADPVLGSLNSVSDATEADPSGVPADRHVLVGRTSVYLGSFDTDAIQQAVEDSDATETEYDGVYEYPNTAVIAWGDGYLLQGDNQNAQNVEQVAAIRNTGDGDQQPRYESSPELQELLTAVDHTGQVIFRYTDDGTLSTGEYSQSIDHSPLEGATGYIGTLRYDVDATEFDATTVVRYPEGASIDTDKVGSIVADEHLEEITQDGRSVRVTASYDRSAVGFDPSDGDDGDDGTDGEDGDDGTDGSDGQDGDDGTDGSDGEDGGDDGQDGSDDGTNTNDSSESSDGSGPGFGVMGAVSAVGGAGYLLSQRLNDSSE